MLFPCIHLYVVNRLHAKGTTYDVDLVLDVNSELFKSTAGDRVALMLAR